MLHLTGHTRSVVASYQTLSCRRARFPYNTTTRLVSGFFGHFKCQILNFYFLLFKLLLSILKFKFFNLEFEFKLAKRPTEHPYCADSDQLAPHLCYNYEQPHYSMPIVYVLLSRVVLLVTFLYIIKLSYVHHFVCLSSLLLFIHHVYEFIRGR